MEEVGGRREVSGSMWQSAKVLLLFQLLRMHQGSYRECTLGAHGSRAGHELTGLVCRGF